MMLTVAGLEVLTNFRGAIKCRVLLTITPLDVFNYSMCLFFLFSYFVSS